MELGKKFPSEVKKIFSIFGDEIRLVGGSVRDLLLKKKVSDFDFATTYLPQEIEKILKKNKIKSVPTGKKFGTITAVINGKNFEITTLRKDNETDGRRCKPQFVDDFKLDAARRDFTINGLYSDAEGKIHDYFDGISDLKKGKVRFIGDAKKRIEEDFLRILRFFRFSCEYGKSLDQKGLAACISLKKNLKKLSRERIRQEFLKLIASSKKDRLIAILKVLKSKKIADEIFSSPLDISAFERLGEVGLKLKTTILLLNENTDLTNLVREICATNQEKKYFKFLISNQPKLELLAFFTKDLVLDLHLFYAAKGIKISQNDLRFIHNFSATFPLTGADVIKLGFKGKEIGNAINAAKKFWAENNFLLNKNPLIQFLKTYENQI